MTELQREAARACRVWIEVKKQLRAEMDPRDFNHFVRPMYLLTVISGFCLLFSLPPNRRIFERARNFAKHGPLLRHLHAQGFHLAGFTAYPSDEQLVALREKFPEQFSLYPAPLRARAEVAAERFTAEDARDQFEEAEEYA